MGTLGRGNKRGIHGEMAKGAVVYALETVGRRSQLDMVYMKSLLSVTSE